MSNPAGTISLNGNTITLECDERKDAERIFLSLYNLMQKDWDDFTRLPLIIEILEKTVINAWNALIEDNEQPWETMEEIESLILVTGYDLSDHIVELRELAYGKE